MDHLLFRSLERDGSLKCRYFTEVELKADPEFAAGWETGDTQELDRAIMLRNGSLWWWARPYMPKEISGEREELVIQNMLKTGVTTIADEYAQQHQDSAARFILVLNRAKGFRLKLALDRFTPLAPGQKTVRIFIDSTMMEHIRTMQERIRTLTGRSKL
jgi:hypothetical protein